MADPVPMAESGDLAPPEATSSSTPAVRADLSLLRAVQGALRQDLLGLGEAVRVTPVADRSSWAALHVRWQLLSVLLGHCLQWEQRHLHPGLSPASGETGSEPGGPGVVLDDAAARAAAVLGMVDSCGPYFGRLASVRDEDAVATLAARVNAARAALEDCLGVTAPTP